MTKSIITLAFIIFATIVHGYAVEGENIAAAPVPEPGTVFLLGVGVLIFAVVGREKKN